MGALKGAVSLLLRCTAICTAGSAATLTMGGLIKSVPFLFSVGFKRKEGGGRGIQSSGAV